MKNDIKSFYVDDHWGVENGFVVEGRCLRSDIYVGDKFLFAFKIQDVMKDGLLIGLKQKEILSVFLKIEKIYFFST